MKLTRVLDWIIVSMGLLSTILVTYYVSQKNKKEDLLRFEYETNSMVRRIQNRMDSYEGTLIQVRAFLRNASSIDRNDLHKFIQDTEIFERFPGLQGIGFSQIIDPKNLPSHIAEMRKEISGYKVFPEGKRNLYSSITLLEPEDRRNKKALGFDMYSEETRRKAMDEAVEKNTAVMTEKIILIQEDLENVKLGFNVYLPHFKKGVDLSSAEARKKGLLGFVYSPFRAEQLFKAIFSEIDMILDIEIYESEMNPEHLYFDFRESTEPSELEEIREININERTLILRATPLENFPKAASTQKTALVFFSGTFLTFLFYSIYLFTRKQMQIARTMANEKQMLLEKEKEHVAARDDFLSIASHELKTPLTSLKLQAQVMQRSINKKDPSAFSEEKVKNLVKQIDNQTTRLTRLVDDMLDISRIRTGRLKMEKSEVDLSELIRDVIERLRPQFMKAIGEIPKTEFQQGIKGHWDRFRLEQVLTNLFTNAIRYGNGKPILVRTELHGNQANICVIDKGIGIARENTEKIFERFERAGMSASEVSGLGLGLFITNQIIKAHGGHIRVESELGKGSTFIAEIPL